MVNVSIYSAHCRRRFCCCSRRTEVLLLADGSMVFRVPKQSQIMCTRFCVYFLLSFCCSRCCCFGFRYAICIIHCARFFRPMLQPLAQCVSTEHRIYIWSVRRTRLTLIPSLFLALGRPVFIARWLPGSLFVYTHFIRLVLLGRCVNVCVRSLSTVAFVPVVLLFLVACICYL